MPSDEECPETILPHLCNVNNPAATQKAKLLLICPIYHPGSLNRLDELDASLH